MQRFILGSGPRQDWALIWIDDSGTVKSTTYFGDNEAYALFNRLSEQLRITNDRERLAEVREENRRLHSQVKRLKNLLRKARVR